TAASAQAKGGSPQTSDAANSTGNRNSAPIGSVSASAAPRPATSVPSVIGRASRNSFSGEPARRASLLAALAAQLPKATSPATVASAATWAAGPTVATTTAKDCANRPTYAAAVSSAAVATSS